MTGFQLFFDAPLTHPVTRSPTSGNRRDVAHFQPTWEATIWCIPQIFQQPLARELS